jgi:hypothetical protein
LELQPKSEETSIRRVLTAQHSSRQGSQITGHQCLWLRNAKYQNNRQITPRTQEKPAQPKEQRPHNVAAQPLPKHEAMLTAQTHSFAYLLTLLYDAQVHQKGN